MDRWDERPEGMEGLKGWQACCCGSAQAIGEQDPSQVIAFVLHHAGMEPVHCTVYGPAIFV